MENKNPKKMSEQDKAKELVEKFMRNGMMITQAKQCALIAVEEILRISIDTSEQYSYYLKVKQEIEKL